MHCMTASLRILVVAPDLAPADALDSDALRQAERSRSLRIGLLESGYNLVAVLPPDAFLQERIQQLQPDLIVVDAESDARDALEHVVMATRAERRPIVMFTNDNDSANLRYAVACGVSAYVVAGMAAERVRPVLDVALARFEREQQLQLELAQTRNELQEQGLALQAHKSELLNRRVIDRAKGLLMQRLHLSEQQAYERLRKTAMDRNLKRVEVAQRMLDVADLLS